MIVGTHDDFQNQPDPLIDNLKLETNTSPQLIVDPQSGFVSHLNSEVSPSSSSGLSQKVIITTSPSYVTSGNQSIDAVNTEPDILGGAHSFFQGGYY